MTRLARAALQILRLTFTREALGPAPASSGRAVRRRHRFLRLLFAIEPLPKDPPATSRHQRPSVAALLFAPEALPRDPQPPPAPRRSWLAALLAPEPLALDPVPPRARRPSWLAALFTVERLDGSK